MAARQGIKNPVDGMHFAISAIDQSKKTVVAAINGQSLGGGCEVSSF
jgi:enoyl-CoA hydratase/carnithine racemase